MEELKITIEILLTDKQDLQNKVVSFSQYGRYPSDDDFMEIHSLLENWFQVKHAIECLTELQSEIKKNKA